MILNLDVDGVIVVFLDEICFTGDLRLTLRYIYAILYKKSTIKW